MSLDSLSENDLADLPEKAQKQVFNALVSRQHSGPLPSPSDIAQYDKYIPDGAERIMSMAEKEQEFRHTITTNSLEQARRANHRGQTFGFLIAVLALSISAAVTLFGFPWVGGVIGGTTVVSLVTAFIYGKSRSDSESVSDEESAS